MSYSNNLSKEEQKERAKEKVEKALVKIKTDVVSVFDNYKLPEFLKFAARFHYFDINNVLLIFKQRPTSTFVASFKAWERFSIENWGDANRQVFSTSQKGKGIGILVPYILKKRVIQQPIDSDGKTKGKVVSYFDYHVVFVFDREQTNDIPAPIMYWDLRKNDIDCEMAFSAFKSKAPFDVVFSLEDNFKLNYSFKEGREDASKRDVLILNPKYRNDYYKLCNCIVKLFTVKFLKNIEKKYNSDDFQKIAECVSFMISSYFGLETEQYIFFFAQTWLDSTDKMLDFLNVIQTAAHSIIETIEDEIAFLKSMYGSSDDFYNNDDIFALQTSFEF